MQRTIKIKLKNNNDLIETMKIFSKIVRIVNEVAVKNKTRNKTKLHNLSYNSIRKQFPIFPTGLIQTARDIACEQLKKEKDFKLFNFKELTSIRYDKRNLRVNTEHNLISISSMKGRLKLKYSDHKQSSKYKAWNVKAGTLKYFDNQLYLNLVVEMQTPVLNIKNIKQESFLGLDRGINNIVVGSNNQFFSSKQLKKVKGKYQHLKKVLQSKGTKSAIRKLKLIKDKEKRFVSDTNHCLSKQLANSDFKVFSIENLTNIKKSSKKGKRFNKKLGNWSFKQFEKYLEYKLEDLGKILIKVVPSYTSQMCSKCFHVEKANRNGSIFKCKKCNYQLHSDLNASKNIVRLGISEFNRLYVNQPIVALNDVTSVTDNSYKPTNSLVGN